jgi:hypothetical protein
MVKDVISLRLWFKIIPHSFWGFFEKQSHRESHLGRSRMKMVGAAIRIVVCEMNKVPYHHSLSNISTSQRKSQFHRRARFCPSPYGCNWHEGVRIPGLIGHVIFIYILKIRVRIKFLKINVNLINQAKRMWNTPKSPLLWNFFFSNFTVWIAIDLNNKYEIVSIKFI